jgi:hypothetical protein
VLKTLGYLVSTVSVFLLAAPGWKSAMEHPPLLICMLAGMSASIGGMLLRWLSFRREQREKQAGEVRSSGTAAAPSNPLVAPGE